MHADDRGLRHKAPRHQDGRTVVGNLACHVEHDRGIRTQALGPMRCLRLAASESGRHDLHTARHAAAGQRMPGGSRRRAGSGDTGHDLPVDAGGVKCINLFIEARKHRWIASLEAHHHRMMAGRFDQSPVDETLLGRDAAAALADRNMTRAGRPFEHLGAHQGVVQHDVGTGKQANRPHGEQIGAARAGSNEPDLAGQANR